MGVAEGGRCGAYRAGRVTMVRGERSENGVEKWMVQASCRT